jgi:adenosylhomocysteine nucleosidase
MTEADDRVDTVVLTALDLEYDAVRAYLTDMRTRTHPAGTLFETGVVRGTSVRVALVVVGAGNRAAAVLVERANALFRPDTVFFVGIAGALRADIDLGDVVVATRVYGYHGGREEAAGLVARPRVWDAPHHLEQQARHMARTAWWEQLLPHHNAETLCKVYFGPVAAGEVVLDSRTGPLAELIRQHYNDAAAVEMESAGAAEAAHLNRSLPMLTIRGISDRADGQKRAADAAGWQSVAASHATAFALTLAVRLAARSSRHLTDSDPHNPSLMSGSAPRDQAQHGVVSMHATAFGESRVYQAGRDQHINER